MTANALNTTEIAVANPAMLIRRHVSEVFAAFIDPAITSRFWFSSGSGPLEPGATVTWHWDMYGFSTQAWVIEVEPDRRILVDWLTGGAPTRIEWRFIARPDQSTFVSITNSGFTGTDTEVARSAIGAMEGFAFVLAGAKAWLEHGIALNLVADRFPDGIGLPPDADSGPD